MERTSASANRILAKQDRLDYLDALKGLSVIMIVVEHHLLDVEFVKHYLCSFSLTPFFLVSGFLYAIKREWELPFRDIAVKNARRLLYPYFTFSAINLLWNVLYYKVAFPSAEPDLYSLREMLLYTVTTYGYNALWFLPCTFFGTLLFAAIRKSRHHKLIWGISAIFLLVFYILFNEPLSGNGLVSYLYCYLFRSAIAMVFLYAGHGLHDLLPRLTQKQEAGLLRICLLCSGIIMLLYLLAPEHVPMVNLAAHHLGNPYLYYLSALAPSVALLLLLRRYANRKSIAAYFGRNSLVIMAMHMDVFVKIGWYAVSKLSLGFGDTISSMIVISLELIMAPVFIMVINRYFPFLTKLPKQPARN